jgi:hypothetical protein
MAYGFGDSARWSEAKEFYFMRPKSDDADRLIRIAEVIIHDWVMNPASRDKLVSYKSLGQGYVEAFRSRQAQQRYRSRFLLEPARAWRDGGPYRQCERPGRHQLSPWALPAASLRKTEGKAGACPWKPTRGWLPSLSL